MEKACSQEYAARLSSEQRREKEFHKQKLKEFMTTKPALQEILRDSLRGEKMKKYIHTYIPKATKIRKDQRTPPETPNLQAT